MDIRFANYYINKFVFDGTVSDLSSGVHVHIDTDIKINEEQSRFDISMVIELRNMPDNGNHFVLIESLSSFFSKDLTGKNAEDVYRNAVRISYDTTRGVLLEKLSISPMNNLLLPIATEEQLGLK